MPDETLVAKVDAALIRFTAWLDEYGETSFDHQSYYAGKFGRGAKALYYRKPLLGTLAVAPMVFSEAFLPAGRRLFWKPQRFPIADAHYAMGFAFLATATGDDKHYNQAVHFLKVLRETRCRGYEDYCWGYPFDWETRKGTLEEGTPLITTIPYVYEAFSQVYAIDGKQEWLGVMRSIAEHAFHSYRDREIGPNAASCAYTPSRNDAGGVINASAYRAFLLTRAAREFSEPRYQRVAERNLNFVLGSQNSDGSWFYSVDGVTDFVDHFHTCFVLKALAKIEELTGCSRCRNAIELGVAYYVKNLFDAEGLPLPFSKAPRLTVYRRELYDYAECLNVGVLLSNRFAELEKRCLRALNDLIVRWQKPDGSFRSRQLRFGWDNVPMHRWAQAQTFRSLSFLFWRLRKESTGDAASHVLQEFE